MENKYDKLPKLKTTQEKKKLIKRVEMKSTKASVDISAPIDQSLPDIQALFINTIIVILA